MEAQLFTNINPKASYFIIFISPYYFNIFFSLLQFLSIIVFTYTYLTKLNKNPFIKCNIIKLSYIMNNQTKYKNENLMKIHPRSNLKYSL